MLVPLSWLRSFCDPLLSTQELVVRLRMTGTKDERVVGHGVASVEHFVVGRVLEVEAHPDADRLSVCSVELGEGSVATIVCGAPNVAAGQMVAVARPGAVMPDGRTLEAAELRGVRSDGMILAEDELGIGPDHAGILVLDGEAAAGTPLTDVLPIADEVIEFEITPNRPDCLGVYGIARELHAATGAPLAPPPWLDDPGSLEPEVDGASVDVECPELCLRFSARAFDGVQVGPSPAWLRARLTAAGMRPISNVVDITNYVMLLTGQPLHAFDLDRVAGGRLVVRRATAGEVVETLDGVGRTCDAETVLICDEVGPTSIAGIMGGARSEVGAETTRVLIEAATWVGSNIHRSALRLGLRSEASARFEKGLSAGSPIEAQAVATRLLLECCGARQVGGMIDVGGAPAEPEPLTLRPARVAALLGAEVPAERCSEILTSLDFAVKVARGGDELAVTVPHFRRADVTREIDLIEEGARIWGLEQLPATLPPRRGAVGRLSHAQRMRRRAADVLAACGLHEIIGWSFTADAVLDRLCLGADDALRSVVRVRNPMSEAQSVMRPTLLGSLLDAAQHNVAHGAGDVAIFESGRVYLSGDGPLAREHHALGAVMTGAAAPHSWRGGESAPADFFAAKGALGAVLDALHLTWELAPTAAAFLHPGRAAAVLVAGEQLGFLGELHPLVSAAWDLDGAAAFELDLDRLVAAAPETILYEDFGAFPGVREDLAVTIPDDVPAARVLEVVRAAGAPILAEVELFDVYRGDQVGPERVSLALHLEFRSLDRTLTAAEVSEQRGTIAAALAAEVGGEIRG